MLLLAVLSCGLLVALILGLILLTRIPTQPTYNGRTLETWLTIYFNGNDSTPEDTRKRREAASAVRHIGTNAIPFLLNWITIEPSRLRAKIERTAYRIPGGIAQNPVIKQAITDKTWYLSSLGEDGFRMLGETASPAIPRLVEIANTTKSVAATTNSISALGYIGPPALEPLAAMARDSRHPARARAMQKVFIIVFHMQDRCKVAPLVIPFARDRNPEIVEIVLDNLCMFSHCEAAPAAVQAMTQVLAGPNPKLRKVAAYRLGAFCSNAPMVVPALLKALKDDDPDIRSGARYSLLDVAPEMLTNSLPVQRSAFPLWP
jgi:HEAT repeat protein